MRESSRTADRTNAGNLFERSSPAPASRTPARLYRGPPGGLPSTPEARSRGALASPGGPASRSVTLRNRVVCGRQEGAGGLRPLTAPEAGRTLVVMGTGRGRPPPFGSRAHAPTTTATSRRERGRSERARRARAGSATEPRAACAHRRPRRVAAEVRAGREEKPSRRGSLTPAEGLGPSSARVRPQGPHIPFVTPAAQAALCISTPAQLAPAGSAGPNSTLEQPCPPSRPCLGRGRGASPGAVEPEGWGGETGAGAAL